MKAAARQIIDDAELDALKTNALERPYDASADVIPTTWTVEHCSKRIVEAFETLAKLPPDRGPRQPGGSWPSYTYDWQDRLAQADMSEAERRRREREQNRTVIRATGVELRKMGLVLDWLHDLHREDAFLCVVVQQWAARRSYGGSIKEMCRQRGISFQKFYRAKNKGVEMIVTRLNAAPIPVF